MGYTHYWYRKPKLDKAQFKLFTEDCRKIFSYAQEQLGIKLADGMGHGEPKITDTSIFFNGSDEQPAGPWTTHEQISIPWPSDLASITEDNPDPSASKTSGNWFAGTLVSQRVAPLNNLTGKGSGSYETVSIEAEEEQVEWDKDEPLIFNFCKTAYRPYDLVVTAVLIALKHHLPEVDIKSDGQEKDWLDGKILCNNLLGYGMDFAI